MNRFLSLKEIADAAKRLSLSKLPASRYGWQKRAQSEGWDENATLCRQRTGVGGGNEYHVSLLPEALQSALVGEVSKSVTVRSSEKTRSVEVAKREALDTTVLNARQRQVMNARAEVLTAIENFQISAGCTRTKAVKFFVAGDISFNLSDETIIAANDRKNNAAIGRSTILGWFQFREQTGIGALAPKTTKENSEIPTWFWAFLKHYARPQKPCITEALDDFLRSEHGINEPITYTKIRRLIAKLGNVEKHRGREGSLTLKARMAYVTRSTGDLLPTCVYTSDGKTFDAEIAHPHHGRPFRPEVTSVVDVATRRCVGFSVGLAENAEGSIDALRAACVKHGVCAIYYVDLGSGFKNKRFDQDLTGLMGRLGITKYHSLPQNSQARGIIERFHKTVWNPLAREYDTYVNAEMDRQARQKAFKVTRKEIREFGSSASLPSFDEFLVRCQQAVDAYNAKTHSALPGRQSPDEYWASHVENGFEPVIVTANESADVFRPYVRRKTRRCLIEYRTNQYFHIGLQEYDGDEVLIGYDIHDASQIWVREIDEVNGEEQGGRLICIAKFSGNEERYIPVTMQRLADEKRAKGRQRRLLDQLVEVEEELNPLAMLDNSPMIPMPSIHTPIDADYEHVAAAPIAATGLPKFGSDIELARWALEHPGDLQPNQVAVLEACLTDLSDRQLLIDHGIDVEELTPIIREALGSIQDKRRANS